MGNTLLNKIDQQIKHSRGAELKALKWILSNANEVLDMSVTQLAKSCGVSEATLIRTCQTLDFSGYRDFRIALAMDISASRSGLIKNTERIYTEDKIETIMQKIFSNYQEALMLSMEGIDVSAFEHAVEKLIAARNIIVISGGTQVGIADYFASRFIIMGMMCTSLNEMMNQRRAASIIQPNDVLVIINHSGCMKTLIKNAEIAHKRGATVIAVTSFTESPLAKIADIVLQTFGKDLVYYSEKGNFWGMTSKVAQIAIIDSLAASISMRCPDVVLPNMENCDRNAESLFTGEKTKF